MLIPVVMQVALATFRVIAEVGPPARRRTLI